LSDAGGTSFVVFFCLATMQPGRINDDDMTEQMLTPKPSLQLIP